MPSNIVNIFSQQMNTMMEKLSIGNATLGPRAVEQIKEQAVEQNSHPVIQSRAPQISQTPDVTQLLVEQLLREAQRNNLQAQQSQYVNVMK